MAIILYVFNFKYLHDLPRRHSCFSLASLSISLTSPTPIYVICNVMHDLGLRPYYKTHARFFGKLNFCIFSSFQYARTTEVLKQVFNPLFYCRAVFL